MDQEKGLSLGAAMIVRDAEKNIEYALRSLLPVCSQIVVVDTGSSDSTPVICSRLGAEVHFYKWNNNFSDARNYSLQFLRTDWAIILDSDEILDYYTLLQNEEAFSRPDVGGLRVRIENHLGDDEQSPISTHTYTRIFRNIPGLCFTGRIHEQIAPSLEKAGLNSIDTDILIRHYGYINTEDEKLKRNIGLLKQELGEKPDDDWLNFHLAETEFAAGNISEAKRLYESLDGSHDLSLEQTELVFMRLAQIAIRNDDFAEIDRRLDFKSDNTDREGFRLYIKAASAMLQKKFAEAYNYYTQPAVGMSRLVDKKEVKQATDALKSVLQIS
jgi:glycosyltransferase involved in cell wall biosynthesis